jgi:hypothetical protein
MKKNTLLPTALSVLAAGGLAHAQVSGTIASIEGNVTSGTTGVTISPSPIITAIGSSPQTLDGYTYGNYAIVAQDATGSLVVFGKATTYFGSYTPAVGDALNVTGTYSPFDGIPELASPSAVGAASHGNTLPTVPTYTIAQVSTSTTTLPQNVEGYLVNIDNVTILTNGVAPIGLNFPTHANGTYTITDGVNSLTLYQWASSYSLAGALGGAAIPTGPVDIEGLVDVFTSGTTSTSEFIPFGITSVPEPSPMALATLGGGALLAVLRRRK